MSTEIINEFESKKAIYLECENIIKRLIDSLIKAEKINVHAIESRVKEIESLKKKIEKKEKYNSINEITDIIGLRLITYFEDDVDKIANLLKKEFILDEINSVDKRTKDNPEEFGYSSLHYILKLKEPRASLPEYKHFKDINFEIQIRSVLQHAWAEIEHDLGYKSKKEIPHSIRRDFSRVSSLLELADKEFIRIKDFLVKYEDEISSQIEENQLAIKIDKVSYTEYLNKSATISEIRDKLMKNYPNCNEYDNVYIRFNPEVLEYFNIYTVDYLDLLLKENKSKIINFFGRWNLDGKYEDVTVHNDTPVFYLFYVLIYLNYKKESLLEYLKLSNIVSSEHSFVIDKMENMISEKFLI